MNPSHDPSRPDRSDEELRLDRALEELLVHVRRQTPTAAALRRTVARAAALADSRDRGDDRLSDDDRPRVAFVSLAWPARLLALVGPSVVAAGLLALLSLRSPHDSPSPGGASARVGSHRSPVISLSLTSISYRTAEADLDAAEQRAQRLTERAILEEIRREANLAATRFRTWND